ncbi:hypothetical protein TWF281_002220 [Arthrobotrys megalospora]
MPRDFIYTGVWELYGEPFHKRWIWTLEDRHAFWLLGIYVVALTLIQKRAWVTVRHYVASWKAPVGFDDRVNPFLNLSQTEALKDVIGWLRMEVPRWVLRARHKILKILGRSTAEYPPRHEEVLDDGAIPWLFGILALVNGLVFISAGVLLPLWLTSGIESPLVQSRWTPFCDERRFFSAYEFRSQSSYAPALHQLCWDNENLSIFDKADCAGLKLENFELLVENKTDCPFPGGICFNDPPPPVNWSPFRHPDQTIDPGRLIPKSLKIRRRGITLRHLGLNSKSPLTLNHELSCAPINLESFIRPGPGNNSFIAFGDHSDGSKGATAGDPDFTWDIELQTLNGPNRWTNESSGLLIALDKKAFGSKTLIRSLDNYSPSDGFDWTPPKIPLHPFLRDDTANVFVAVYKAGPTQHYYSNIKDDLVFQANTDPVEASGKGYGGIVHPNYEATAIGCKERFQYCLKIPGGLDCEPWSKAIEFKGSKFAVLWRDDVETSEFQDKVQDTLWRLKVVLSEHLSVSANSGDDSSSFPSQYISKLRNSYYPWVDEVVSWYMITWWNALNDLQTVVSSKEKCPPHKLPNGDDMEFGGLFAAEFGRKIPKNPWGMCQTVLLTDADYTNINFIGFLISLTILSSLYIFSYANLLLQMAEIIKNQGKRIPVENWTLKMPRYPVRVVRFIYSFWGRLRVRIFGNTSSIRPTSVFNGSAIGLENIFTGTGLESAAAWTNGASFTEALGNIEDYHDDPLPMVA